MTTARFRRPIQIAYNQRSIFSGYKSWENNPKKLFILNTRSFGTTNQKEMRGAVVREFGGHENIRIEDGLPVPNFGENQARF